MVIPTFLIVSIEVSVLSQTVFSNVDEHNGKFAFGSGYDGCNVLIVPTQDVIL